MCIYMRIQTLPLQFLLCRQSWQFFVQRESMKDFFFSWKFVQDCVVLMPLHLSIESWSVNTILYWLNST